MENGVKTVWLWVKGKSKKYRQVLSFGIYLKFIGVILCVNIKSVCELVWYINGCLIMILLTTPVRQATSRAPRGGKTVCVQVSFQGNKEEKAWKTIRLGDGLQIAIGLIFWQIFL